MRIQIFLGLMLIVTLMMPLTPAWSEEGYPHQKGGEHSEEEMKEEALTAQSERDEEEHRHSEEEEHEHSEKESSASEHGSSEYKEVRENKSKSLQTSEKPDEHAGHDH